MLALRVGFVCWLRVLAVWVGEVPEGRKGGRGGRNKLWMDVGLRWRRQFFAWRRRPWQFSDEGWASVFRRFLDGCWASGIVAMLGFV